FWREVRFDKWAAVLRLVNAYIEVELGCRMNMSCNLMRVGAVDEAGWSAGAARTQAAVWPGRAGVWRACTRQFNRRAYGLYGRLCDAHGNRFQNDCHYQSARRWTCRFLFGELR